MANYLFSVDGEETAEVGRHETAYVYNLDFFDTTDKVRAYLSAVLAPSPSISAETSTSTSRVMLASGASMPSRLNPQSAVSI